MPVIEFQAFINVTSSRDPGHMVVLDYENGDKFLDFKGGEILSHVGQSKVVDVRTGQPYKADTKKLIFNERNVQEHWPSQLNEKRMGQTNFTDVYAVRVNVTGDEYSYIRGRISDRLGVGYYNMMYEAKEQVSPLATRCLSLLEDLADRRGQALIQGNAHLVLADFCGKNQATIGDEYITPLTPVKNMKERYQNPLYGTRISS